VNGLFEAALFAAAEHFDAVPELVHAVGVEEFADGDGEAWIDAALVNPFLDAVEVDGDEVEGEARK
jgi:hypothetical protein